MAVQSSSELGIDIRPPLISKEVSNLLTSWGINNNLQRELQARVEGYSGFYTNLSLRAKAIAKAPKYIDNKSLIFIRNAYNAMEGYPAGECGDIAHALSFQLDYLGINDEMAQMGVHVIKASGNEPIFFNYNGLNHVFLVLYHGDRANLNPLTLNPEECVIIDPAMQKVVHYPGSNYKIKDIDFEWNRHPDATIYLNHTTRDKPIAVQGKNMILLGLTKDRKYTVTLHYREINGKPFPVIVVSDGNEHRASLYTDPETQQFYSNTGDILPGISPSTNAELEEILRILQNPVFQPITSDGLMVDIHGNITTTYFDDQGASLGSPFTKKT